MVEWRGLIYSKKKETEILLDHDFKDFMDKIKAFDNSEIENVLHIYPISKKGKIECDFLLIRCTKDNIREDDFLTLLKSGIIHYTVPYCYIDIDIENLSKEEIVKQLLKKSPDLTHKALMEFSTKSKYFGEIGELFLFILLESKGIVQVLNKMSLKTSRQMPVHGLDGVHIYIDESENIILFYSYSKMIQEFNAALNDSLNEMIKFCDLGENKEHEIFLVSTRIDNIKFGKYTDKIVNLISPYERHKEKLSETHSMLLGYEWDLLKETVENGSISDYYNSNYQRIIEELYEKISTKIGESKVSDKSFLIFILPFKNLENTRSGFKQMLEKG